MKNLLVGLVAFCAFSVSALADHANLQRQAAEVTQQARMLAYEAQRVVGFHPSYHQKYALEHIQFLDRSATRMLQTIQWGMREDSARDHAHDNRIRQAYYTLERDAYNARSTFNDLFLGRDHAAYERLDHLLESIEHEIREMRYNLP